MRERLTFVTLPATGHMPFRGSRTQKQVREDEEAFAAALGRIVTADKLERRLAG